MICSTHGRVAALAVIAVMLAACGEVTVNSPPAQVAATVNGTPITAAELDAATPQTPNGTPDAYKATSAAVLQRLIEQRLLVQEAREAKLDRDPEVMLAMENAKRTTLANEWLRRAISDIPPPSDHDIQDYFSQHPELFSGRRAYAFRLAVVQAPPNELPKIQEQLAKTKSLDEVLHYLRANNRHFVDEVLNMDSEQLPEDLLRRFQEIKQGDEIAFVSDDSIHIAQLISERAEPLDVAQARPLIETLLRTKIEKEHVETELAPLRANAKIELVGDFRPEASSSGGGPNADRVTEGIAAGLR